MIEPLLKNDALLDDMRTATPQAGGVSIWWLGQSGFLVKSEAGHLLFDPYLSDSLTRKYSETDKPHTRMTRQVIQPAALDFIDVATSTHNHTDHLDADTLNPLIAGNPQLKLVVPEANRAFVADRLQCAPAFPIGMCDGDTVDVGPFQFTAVPAAHEAIDRDGQGRCVYLGYVVQVDAITIYHSGDTIRYDGMVEILKPLGIDVAILPINGRAPERRVAGNLDGAEAARLAKDIGAGLVIPCHYDMFEFNTASPDLFVETCEALGQEYHVMQNGSRWDSDQMSAAKVQ
jgi:L-ascorbate metabolism protein UlaG (beta-lactamase superfamily)